MGTFSGFTYQNLLTICKVLLSYPGTKNLVTFKEGELLRTSERQNVSLKSLKLKFNFQKRSAGFTFFA